MEVNINEGEKKANKEKPLLFAKYAAKQPSKGRFWTEIIKLRKVMAPFSHSQNTRTAM